MTITGLAFLHVVVVVNGLDPDELAGNHTHGKLVKLITSKTTNQIFQRPAIHSLLPLPPSLPLPLSLPLTQGHI